MIPAHALAAQSLATPAFRGVLGFCSNMHPAPVFGYRTVEHDFVAARTQVSAERSLVRSIADPIAVKRLGRRLRLRPDWNSIKLEVMERLVREKFTAPSHLRTLLLATRDVELVERNHWRDTFWGVCGGRGQNHLGRLLMQVRNELLQGPPAVPAPLWMGTTVPAERALIALPTP
jgi:ribA/ribD-fused uncharacterized protein